MFWGTSIQTFALGKNGGRAPIILVGTRADKVNDDIVRRKFDEARTIIDMDVHGIAINNASKIQLGLGCNYDPKDLQELRRMVLNCGLGIADESVPAPWIGLENAIEQESGQLKTFKDIQELNASMVCPLQNEHSLRIFLEHMHSRGQLLYFPENTPDDLIILDPNLLIVFLNTLMRTFVHEQRSYGLALVDKKNRDGMVSKAYMMEAAEHALSTADPQNATQLLRMIIRLKIAFPYKHNRGRNPIYILPNMLPDHKDIECADAVEKGPKLQIRFHASCVTSWIPLGFYHQVLLAILSDVQNVSLSTIQGLPQIFKTKACLQYFNKFVLIDISWDNNTIYVDINNYSTHVSLSDLGVHEFILGLERALKTTREMYRNEENKMFLGIECPQHRNCFLDVQKIRTDGEEMCERRHCVDIADLYKRRCVSFLGVSFNTMISIYVLYFN